jgi:hypothetical protein
MAVRDGTRIKTKRSEPTEADQEQFTQRTRAAEHRFRLQVDRQTKSSYTTADAAEEIGLAIKRDFPIVQVVVHDTEEGTRKVIELPAQA